MRIRSAFGTMRNGIAGSREVASPSILDLHVEDSRDQSLRGGA